MKTIIILAVLALAIAGGLIWGFLEMSQERELEAGMEEPIMAESRAQRTPAGTVLISLEAPAQTLLGIKTVQAVAVSLPREIKAYGEVIEPAPLFPLLGEIASADTALEYASKELGRLKALHAQDENVSKRAVENGEAEVKRGQIVLETARRQLVSAWGEALASRPDLPALVESLATRRSLLVQVNLTAGQELQTLPVKGRVRAASGAQATEVSWIGLAPRTDPQWQGPGYLLVLSNSAAQWSPGLAVVAFLQWAGEPRTGVRVPSSAVVRQAAKTWVFVQVEPAKFERREIELEEPMEDDWFVAGGISPGEKLVVTGAQALLSEENKLQIKMAD